jgi:MFS family permease
VMAIIALLPNTLPALVTAGFLLLNGMGAGFSLAVLSHMAMAHVPAAQSGAAAGLHSTIRFTGGILGITICGVILRQLQDLALVPADTYQVAYAFLAAVALLAVLLAWRLRGDSEMFGQA